MASVTGGQRRGSSLREPALGPGAYPPLQEHVSEVGHPLLQRQEDLGRRPGALVLSLRLLWARAHEAFGPLGHKTQRVKRTPSQPPKPSEELFINKDSYSRETRFKSWCSHPSGGGGVGSRRANCFVAFRAES